MATCLYNNVALVLKNNTFFIDNIKKSPYNENRLIIIKGLKQMYSQYSINSKKVNNFYYEKIERTNSLKKYLATFDTLAFTLSSSHTHKNINSYFNFDVKYFCSSNNKKYLNKDLYSFMFGLEDLKIALNSKNEIIYFYLRINAKSLLNNYLDGLNKHNIYTALEYIFNNIKKYFSLNISIYCLVRMCKVVTFDITTHFNASSYSVDNVYNVIYKYIHDTDTLTKYSKSAFKNYLRLDFHSNIYNSNKKAVNHVIKIYDKYLQLSEEHSIKNFIIKNSNVLSLSNNLLRIENRYTTVKRIISKIKSYDYKLFYDISERKILYNLSNYLTLYDLINSKTIYNCLIDDIKKVFNYNKLVKMKDINSSFNIINYNFSVHENKLFRLGRDLYNDFKKDDYVDLVALKKECYSLRSDKNKDILSSRDTRYRTYQSYRKAIDFYIFISENYSEKIKDIDLIDDVVSSLENNNLLGD